MTQCAITRSGGISQSKGCGHNCHGSELPHTWEPKSVREAASKKLIHKRDLEDKKSRMDQPANLILLLSSACRTLDRLRYDLDENPQLSRWWDVHKAEDRKKRLGDQKAKRLLNKAVKNLTKEEKTLLRSKGLI